MIRAMAAPAFVALSLLSLSACQRPQEPASIAPARPVLSMVVQPQSNSQLRLAGTIASRTQTDLGFRLAGRLVSRSVNIGDRVTAGQVLAEIDPSGLELALRTANAELASAKMQDDNAQGIARRQRELFASGSITQANLELIELRLQLAQAGLVRALNGLHKAENQLGYAQLRAEFDGVVTAVHIEPGRDITPGQPILTIAKPDLRDAVVDVPESVAGTLQIGAAFQVLLQLEPSFRTEGILLEIAPEADPATRMRRIKIGLIDPDPAFRIGTTVTVLAMTQTQTEIEIPASAILQVGQRSYVWRIDEDKGVVSQHEIVLRERNGDMAVVAEGLAPGMRVATAGANSLENGQAIRATGIDQ